MQPRKTIWALAALAVTCGTAYAAPGFNELDRDDDGSLTRAEAAGNPQLAARFNRADTNNDGRLTRFEYLRMMTAMDIAPDRPASAGASAERVEAGFNELDKDGDSALTRAEAAGNPYLAQRFQRADEDNDGKLSRLEYLSVVGARDLRTFREKLAGFIAPEPEPQQRAAAGGTAERGGRLGFNELDRDDDGVLTRAEAARKPELAARFNRADTDNNGRLTRFEYLRMMTALDISPDDKASASAGATTERVEAGFNELDKDGDAALTRAEAAGNPYLAKRFQQADRDDDGKLSRLEYLSVVGARDLRTLREKLADFVAPEPEQRASAGASAQRERGGSLGFNELDRDDDGTLTRAEAAAKPELARQFQQADRDNDRRLTRFEYLRVMTAQDIETARNWVAGVVRPDEPAAAGGGTGPEKK